MRWCVRLMLSILCTTLAGTAGASNGGPEIAEPLGWDAVERKAFFTIAGMDESGEEARVVYFRSGGSPLGYVVDWSRGKILSDSTYARNLLALRRRLQPLPVLSAPTIPEIRRVLVADTMEAYRSRWPRFVVRAHDLQCLGGGTLEVTTIGDPDVRVLRQYWIPDSLRLGIVSFRGIPWEMGYEAQVPVILPAEGETLKVEWKNER